jgi:hypothetical protein
MIRGVLPHLCSMATPPSDSSEVTVPPPIRLQERTYQSKKLGLNFELLDMGLAHGDFDVYETWRIVLFEQP